MESVKYIEGRKGNEQPFFLYVALPAPHTPWLPTKEFRGKTNNMYSDFVAMVDDTVGQVLSALDRTQLSKNTLVIFTSDNGPVWYNTDTERFGHSATTPLRGMKADAWEAGHRMPFIVRWPGKVPAGKESDAVFATIDFMPTFAKLCGFKAPGDRVIDGVDQSALLMGKSQKGRESFYFDRAGIRKGKWKAVRLNVRKKPDGPIELYDLSRDIGETKNLSDKHPDLIKEMARLMTDSRTVNPTFRLFR